MSIDGPIGPLDDGQDYPDQPTESGHAGQPADRNASRRGLAETRSRQEYDDDLRSGHGFEADSFGSLMAARSATERPEWEDLLSSGEVDRCGLGVIDETSQEILTSGASYR